MSSTPIASAGGSTVSSSSASAMAVASSKISAIPFAASAVSLAHARRAAKSKPSVVEKAKAAVARATDTVLDASARPASGYTGTDVHTAVSIGEDGAWAKPPLSKAISTSTIALCTSSVSAASLHDLTGSQDCSSS